MLDLKSAVKPGGEESKVSQSYLLCLGRVGSPTVDLIVFARMAQRSEILEVCLALEQNTQRDKTLNSSSGTRESLSFLAV